MKHDSLVVEEKYGVLIARAGPPRVRVDVQVEDVPLDVLPDGHRPGRLVPVDLIRRVGLEAEPEHKVHRMVGQQRVPAERHQQVLIHGECARWVARGQYRVPIIDGQCGMAVSFVQERN